GKLYKVLLAEFGEAILSADGSLDRAKIGQAVFADSNLRARLSVLKDKIIMQEMMSTRDALKQTEDVIFMYIHLL
ncbi:dephospho-CoA kinase, partial [Streptococcus suis]